MTIIAKLENQIPSRSRQILLHSLKIGYILHDLIWLRVSNQFVSNALINSRHRWASSISKLFFDHLHATKVTHIRVLLSGHGQVGLLQLLSVDGILEQRQIVECLLLVQISTTLSKFSCKCSKHIVDSVCANVIEYTIKGAQIFIVT